MHDIVYHSARQFARAIIMPNLNPPIVTTDMAMAYRSRILAALPLTMQSSFEPLMTLYLTDNTPPEEVVRAKQSGIVHGVKLYPAGATTNSAAGVTDISKCYATLEAMQKIDLPLLVHGEVTSAEVDVFDREKIFIERVLSPLVRRFPNLRIVFEHVTTHDAVAFVRESSQHIAASITAHHLLLNRNALFQGGIRPHHFCLPVIKHEKHRLALVQAATSGDPKFFLGTDSAPHERHTKESACGCAGIFNAPYAIESYAAVFDEEGALDKLEGFASENGPNFYGLPLNQDTITLERSGTVVPDTLPAGESKIVPFHADETLGWKLV